MATTVTNQQSPTDFYRASLIDADEEQLIFCYIQGEPLTQPMTHA